MSKISKSPDRYTFQKVSIKDYLDLNLFGTVEIQEYHRFEDPESRKNSLEYDLLTTSWILEKVRKDEAYAQNLYAALCNNNFQKLDIVTILKEQTWRGSWRYVGGIVADMCQKGDYIDWYCSGMLGNAVEEIQDGTVSSDKKFVPEGCITDEIRNDLQRLGWVATPGGDWEKFK